MKTITLNRFIRVTVRSTLLPAALVMCLPATGIVSQAHAWWGCPSGFNLEFRNNPVAARCLRAASQQRVTPDAGCPVGSTFNQDFRNRNTDYCLPLTGTVVGGPFVAECAPGQQKQIVRGRDRCFKVVPAAERQVDRNVN